MIDLEQIIKKAVYGVLVENGFTPRETTTKSVPGMGMTEEEDAAERRREDDKVKALEAKLRDEERRRDEREARRRRREIRGTLGI